VLWVGLMEDWDMVLEAMVAMDMEGNYCAAN
jgi:hypothetical protein